MEELTNKLTLAEIDQRITRSAVEAVIEIGYYLKQIRDRKLYLEAGCKDVYEYAEKQYGYSQSTTSRNMNRNDKFSVGGNSPELAEEYRQYSKSQLQEMLSLEDKQLKEVRPEMTVKQIREMKPKKKKSETEAGNAAEPVHRFKNDLEAYGWSWHETVKKYLETGYESDRKETEIEVFGKTVVVSRQDDITVFKGKGGPVLFEVENTRLAEEYDFYNRRNLLNATSHKPEMKKSVQVPQPEQLSALGFQKTVRPEGSLITTPGCGKGKYDCFSCHRECEIRQEECYCVHAPLGNPYPCIIVQNGLEQLEFAADGCQFLNLDLADHREGDGEPMPCCEKCGCKDNCDAVCDRVKKSVAMSHKESAAEMQQEETECCEDAAAEEAYTPQYFLEEQKARLDEILSLGEDEVKLLPRKMVDRQKTIVAALAAMVCDLEELEEPVKPEQPELPAFKNNDQRKEWLRNYRDWGLWYADDNIGARYFRYEFENGAVLVAEEYEHSNGYAGHYVSSFLHLVGGPKPAKGSGGYGKWQWNEKYNRYPNSETELVEFLKEVQKK